MAEQVELLNTRFGHAMVGRVSFFTDEAKSLSGVAMMAYGDGKYAPLVQAFNGRLASSAASIPRFTRINVLQPLNQEVQTVMLRSIRLSVSAMSRAQLYDNLRSYVKRILASAEYENGPEEWWVKEMPGGPIEFADGLSGTHGRKWGMGFYQVEAGETAGTVAKIIYGSTEFLPLLRFTNAARDRELREAGTTLDEGLALKVVRLSEF